MPERWQTEVRKLRSLAPPDTVPEPRRNVGVAGPPMRQRAVAAIVALAVFAGGGLFVWRAFAPAPRPGVGNVPIGEGPLLPNVARVRCTERKTHVLTRVVRPQVDGIHLLVDDPSGAHGMSFTTRRSIRSSFRNGSIGVLAISPGAQKQIVERSAPGTIFISCSRGSVRSPTHGRNWARLNVKDPQGLWVSPDLNCTRHERSRFDVHGYTGDSFEVTPEEIRSNLPSIRPSDGVQRVGYPGVDMWKIGRWYAVVRNEQTVATISFWQVDGAATIYTCPGSGITRPGHPWNES